jgi:hypothetical protein
MANEKTEILKLLISNREELFSIRKISLLREINYKSAYTSLKSLEEDGIVELKRIGNTLVSKFNNKFNDLVFKAEYLRREGLFKNRNFLVIYNRLAELKSPFILLVFGSYAKGTQTKHSDIDLLAVCDEKAEKLVEKELDLIPLKIHATYVNYEGFIRMATSKEFSVVSEALKKNIILIGIEEYYRLLKNAR